MPIQDFIFLDFVEPLVQRLRERNRIFHQNYGEHRFWDWNPDTVRLTYYDPVLKPVQIDVSIVGTLQNFSWEWSWANPNIAEAAKIDMDKVRDFGLRHSYQVLIDSCSEGGEEAGIQMTAVAVHVLNAPGSFHFDTGRGLCFVLYRKILSLEELDPSLLYSNKKTEKRLPEGIDLDALARQASIQKRMQ